MAFSFGFFHDSALTNPIEAGDKLTATQDVDGVLGAVDTTIYFGSPSTGTQVEVASNPGVTAISVSVTDTNAGTGAPSTIIKLALSSGALAGATAGAALTLSTTVTSGVANAVPIYTRIQSSLTTVDLYEDVGLTTQELIETPV